MALKYTVTLGLFALFLEVATEGIHINITSVWKPDFGWEVTCMWETPPNDTLQSVRLQNNGQQFMIYRPEIHGASRAEAFRTPENVMSVDCTLTATKGRKGRCVLTIEPYQPPSSDFTYTCEVSGERPTFMIERMDYVVKTIVPPSSAELEYKKYDEVSPGRVMMNCTSSGLPAPNLQWTVANDKVQADFTGRFWNRTTKLWHVWSFFAYTRADPSTTVTCSPEVLTHEELLKGTPATFSSASIIDSASTLIVMFTIMIFLR
ncbi:PREDICTED: uncharacterized protein LOC106121806 [Papilio xuthus]|uniref:Uncharacterized protein LOC106121806 n=1 Tax=Papilio xuthus TaxID=66420 RepID=A0AAJ6ZI66_PAPXU|nr:PREDICTED: uncharacterized protein LOC106121806 [Papilio xuthus]